MAKNTLLRDFSKYLKSEGIYCSQIIDTTSNNSVPVIVACISKKFIVFDINKILSNVITNRILKNGGVIYSPTSLEEFVSIVRTLESEDK